MRWTLVVGAVVALVLVGAAESAESARQLAELPGRGRPLLTGGGAVLTLVGLGCSVAIYGLLGWSVARAGASAQGALRTGVAVGICAGLIGGTVRAAFVRDYVVDTVARFGLRAEVATGALAIFVLGAMVVSAAGGGALTWLGFRFAPLNRPRPRS